MASLPFEEGKHADAGKSQAPLSNNFYVVQSTTVGGINICSTALGSPSKIQASKTPDPRYFLFSI
jgi:hypothetical protein